MEAFAMNRSWIVGAFVLCSASLVAAPFTATDMMKLKRISDPQVSPDGKVVLFVQTDVDLGSNSKKNDIWAVPLAGGAPRRLTNHPQSTRPRWSPDGTQIAFLSTRDGSSQVYLMDPQGVASRKVTAFSTDVDAFLWIDGKRLLISSAVFPECADEACNKAKLAQAGKPSSARVYDRLLFRHWDTWSDGRRSHLFAVDLASGQRIDLTPGDADAPPFSLDGPEDYAVSPDGGELCYAEKDSKDEAYSTNAELYVIPTKGGDRKKIAGHPGYDGSPKYSPDGTQIAYRAQMRDGFESDRWRLMVYDRKTGKTGELTPTFDRWVDEFAWSRDGRTLYFAAAEAAREPVYSVAAEGGPVQTVLEGGTFSDITVTGPKGLLLSGVSLTHPAELYTVSTDGTGLAALTHVNDATLAPFALRPGESVTYAGSAGKTVQAWIVKPPDFDPSKRYPLVVLIHGGPQGTWSDGWSFRWNPQVFAGAGFVAFMPNPRGSIGWGQDFINDVTNDWGGRAYEDIMKGTDYAEALPYIAKGRTVAAGASFGGYMINWIAGHTDRFKALVSHDGDFDLLASYGGTEELWFAEWEMGGPFWKNREGYAKWSPSTYAQNFKTPTLVIHGEKDYRVPLTEGLSMFTALKRQGVPSRLVVFPDENHWVLKPANSVRWYQEVLSWLTQWSSR
jgi:dipeptidyl aminopeptidase/acylaminoacyl peptidase